MRTLRILSLLTALGLVTSTARAQDTAQAARPDSDVMILDITVDPAANARQTVFLQKGVVYRVRFGGPGITISMRSRGNRQLPFLVNTTGVADASGATEYELYPQSDGDIELTPTANDAQVPVRFQIWRDARATERGRRRAEAGFWELGVEGTFGFHGAYTHDGDELANSGALYGGCLSFRNGPGQIGRLNGCAFGIESHRFKGGEQELKFYMEPRIRIIGSGSRHSGWGTDAGLVLHIGFSEGAGGEGTIITGVGAYVARDLRADQEGRGWRFVFQVRHDTMRDGAETPPLPPFFETDIVDVSSTNARLAVGYYW